MSNVVEQVAKTLYEEHVELWRTFAPETFAADGRADLTWETEGETYRDNLRHEARQRLIDMALKDA